MTDEVKFCYKCGASLPDGADFCPECGASVNADGERAVPDSAGRTATVRQDSLGAIPVLILVYGIFALIVAFFAFMSGVMLDTMLEMLKKSMTPDDYQEFLKMIGAATEAGMSALKTNLIIEGILFALSGIAAIVSSHFCGKLENYKIAFYMCIAASALTVIMVFIGDISGLILAIVGFIMCYLIYQNRHKFTS